MHMVKHPLVKHPSSHRGKLACFAKAYGVKVIADDLIHLHALLSVLNEGRSRCLRHETNVNKGYEMRSTPLSGHRLTKVNGKI